MNPLLTGLRRGLIVSCQARPGDPFRDPESMARFARAAVAAGAAAIRADGAPDIVAIRAVVRVPVLGIQKRVHTDGKVLITPSFEDARVLRDAGADLVALDCTARGQAAGALERLARIRSELSLPVLADIATVEEAAVAAVAGADAVLSTMRGYTPETQHVRSLDLPFVAELARTVQLPVIAEGWIETPEQAREALDAGAYAVVVGKAITRPESIARRFVVALAGGER